MLVPRSLRRWFTLDFILALIAGLPLLVAPEWSLQQLSWGCVDPWVTRILASAVIALGTQSLLHRGSSALVCLAIIHQKCVWSLVASGAILGELWKQGWRGMVCDLPALVRFAGCGLSRARALTVRLA